MGNTVVHSAAGDVLLLAFCGVASATSLDRRIRSTIATLGLITSSVLLVHLSGGYIELHFHFL